MRSVRQGVRATRPAGAAPTRETLRRRPAFCVQARRMRRENQGVTHSVATHGDDSRRLADTLWWKGSDLAEAAGRHMLAVRQDLAKHVCPAKALQGYSRGTTRLSLSGVRQGVSLGGTAPTTLSSGTRQ